MDLRQLRYFVAVAEELSFRRAADRLHISQPPLSRQIKVLEEDLGGALFERTQQKVFLTPAGRVFLTHAQHVLAEAAKAKVAAKRAIGGEEGELRIGFTQSAEFLPFLPKTIHHFRRDYPGIALVLKEMTSAAQVESVEEHRIDLGIMRKPRGRLTSAVRLSRLSADPVLLAVPESDSLSRKKAVQVSELKGVRLICTAAYGGAGLHGFVHELCWTAGFAPNIVQEVQEVSTLVPLVASGLGVAVIPAPMQCIKLPGVCFRELVGRGTRANLFVISNAKDKNRLTAELRQRLIAAAAS